MTKGTGEVAQGVASSEGAKYEGANESQQPSPPHPVATHHDPADTPSMPRLSLHQGSQQQTLQQTGPDAVLEGTAPVVGGAEGSQQQTLQQTGPDAVLEGTAPVVGGAEGSQQQTLQQTGPDAVLEGTAPVVGGAESMGDAAPRSPLAASMAATNTPGVETTLRRWFAPEMKPRPGRKGRRSPPKAIAPIDEDHVGEEQPEATAVGLQHSQGDEEDEEDSSDEESDSAGEVAARLKAFSTDLNALGRNVE
ncbi:hypothetical protein WJX79_000022 [Trebouxia sp. C0005]